MNRILSCAAGFACLTAAPAQAGDEAWDDAGTAGRLVLVAAALGVPAAQGDWKGDLQAAASMGVASLATTGLKETFPRMRPDGSDDRSFPSGHTSVSFAAAATLTNRYGWKVGLPAHALAAFVGASRVKARKHHVSDVLVGAAIGELSGFLITSKLNDNVAIIPWADAEGGGVLVTGRF
ncbi:MAG TPA: phosphatase PAP2 family protein [Parvularculaceae bacterium]|nr:phosphatase PAP2 family protein [Parvularculaceae bacterium]